jgi:hypothetical protein
VFCTVENEDFFRGEMNTFSGNVTSNLKTLMYKTYVGVKFERQSTDNRVGFATGLRFTRLSSSIGKDNYYRSSSDFFHFMYASTDNSITYYRIKELNQISDYIGVPLEVRYNAFATRRRWNLYFKIAFEFSVKVTSKSDVIFVDEAMHQEKDLVMRQFGDSDLFTSVLSTAAGFSLGRNSKRQVKIEIGPSLFLTKYSSSIVVASGSVGPQINIQFPL